MHPPTAQPPSPAEASEVGAGGPQAGRMGCFLPLQAPPGGTLVSTAGHEQDKPWAEGEKHNPSFNTSSFQNVSSYPT